MNIPPFLEKLLLSNEAIFKNATLGMSGQNMVYVPPGKSAVLLEVSIEPFINQVTPGFLTFLTNGVGETASIFSPSYRLAIRRLHYQLQIINDNYSTYFNLANQLNLRVNRIEAITNRFEGLADLEFNGHREELFIYADRSMYFNIIYPYKVNDESADDSGLTPTYTTPVNGFLPKIQNLPKSPITFNNNAFVDYVSKVVVNSPALDAYYPVGHQTNPAFATESPQMEYLRFFQISNETSIQQPIASGNNYDWHDLLTIPFINVKYALLNKRPSDYGLTMPAK